MTIDRSGFPFIAAGLVPAAGCLAAGWPLAAGGFLVVGVCAALFFRDPERVTPARAGAVVAPADGRVLHAGAADGDYAPAGSWLQISIFLSPLDVHVNRIPIGGRITRVQHVPGRFLRAYRHGAGALNERNEIWVDHDGETIVFRQVVGTLARRIVCRVTEGMRVQTGQRFGIMKFGSRMDVFVPPAAALLVGAGDKVRGGETVVAELAGSGAGGRV